MLKNFFKSRDIVFPVPVGIELTLEYDSKGVLHKIYGGFEKRNYVSERLNQAIRGCSIVPSKIHLRGSKTYITGVIYTKKHYQANGMLPDCIEDQMIADFILDQRNFKFLAGMIKSEGQNIAGIALAAQTLKMAGFTTLPYFLITEPVNESHIKQIISPTFFPYGYPMITKFLVFRDGEMLTTSTGIAQYEVSNGKDPITTKYRYNGELRALIDLESDRQIECAYSDLNKFNIYPGTMVVVDYETKQLIYSYTFDEDKKNSPKRPDKISCPTCGRLIKVPNNGPTLCSDPHCPSRLYPKIQNFTEKLNMPKLTFAQYEALRTADPKIKTLQDVIYTPYYSSTKVKTSLSRFLSALVLDLSDDECMKLVDLCNKTSETLIYYMENPTKVRSDFNLKGIWVNKFIKWCSDASNVQEFKDLLYDKHFEVEQGYKAFEGAPMFRNMKIGITGSFKHGTLSNIVDILQSYSATVTTTFEHDMNVVLLGDLAENVDGRMITKARKNNIPIMEEDMFFKKYEIDDDLAKFF